MKFVSSPIYHIDLKECDIDCINKVAKIFDKTSRGIHPWLQYL